MVLVEVDYVAVADTEPGSIELELRLLLGSNTDSDAGLRGYGLSRSSNSLMLSRTGMIFFHPSLHLAAMFSIYVSLL